MLGQCRTSAFPWANCALALSLPVVGVTVWAVRIWLRCTPDRAELKPNVQIFIAGATRDPGGTLEASRVTVGKDDIPPPM